MNSVISEMPGPLVGVNARAPFHDAPSTIPIAASSSSAWMMQKSILAGLRVATVAGAEVLERIHQRGRRRDRIPGADRRARIHAPEARGGVAVDHDVAARLRATLQE